MAHETPSGKGTKAEVRPTSLRQARLRAVPDSDLQVAPGTPGLVRRFAFREDSFDIIHVRGGPGIESAWHHHGGHDVYGFVIAGRMRLEGDAAGTDAIEVGPGDFFHVPAGLIHRDVNPSDTEPQEGLLYMVGDGPIVVNVDGPEAA